MSPRAKNQPKKKRPFNPSRYTYDPQVEGLGSVREWRQTFYARMGFEEAVRILTGDKKPHEILGVSITATWAEIKSAYRKLSMQFHPDRIVTTGLDKNFAEEQFKRISAAYTILAKKFGE